MKILIYILGIITGIILDEILKAPIKDDEQ